MNDVETVKSKNGKKEVIVINDPKFKDFIAIQKREAPKIPVPLKIFLTF